jgi:hypothetical protein
VRCETAQLGFRLPLRKSDLSATKKAFGNAGSVRLSGLLSE